jgi:hypothetical protein
MLSLYDVHEMDACLSVHMIQLENRLMDLDEIWYGRYAIGATLNSYFTVSYNR